MKKYLNHASLGLPRCSERVAGFFAFVGFLRHLRGLAAISSSASAFSSARNSRLARAILVSGGGTEDPDLEAQRRRGACGARAHLDAIRSSSARDCLRAWVAVQWPSLRQNRRARDEAIHLRGYRAVRALVRMGSNRCQIMRAKGDRSSSQSSRIEG